MKVTLTYFKEYGKYYTEGSFEMEEEQMYKVCDYVRDLEIDGKLPDVGKWTEGHIHVYTDSDKYYFPCLIMKGRR